MWFHVKLCWKQTNISILLLFILELISDLCSFAFSIVLYETIHTFKVMFLSLDPIFLIHSHNFFTLFCFSSKNLCYLNCILPSLMNLYLIKIFASSLETGVHTAHWPWALESKHLAMCLLLVVLWDKCSLLRVHAGENCSDSSLYKNQKMPKCHLWSGCPLGRKNINSCCTWFLFLSSSTQLLEKSIGQQ